METLNLDLISELDDHSSKDVTVFEFQFEKYYDEFDFKKWKKAIEYVANIYNIKIYYLSENEYIKTVHQSNIENSNIVNKNLYIVTNFKLDRFKIKAYHCFWDGFALERFIWNVSEFYQERNVFIADIWEWNYFNKIVLKNFYSNTIQTIDNINIKSINKQLSIDYIQYKIKNKMLAPFVVLLEEAMELLFEKKIISLDKSQRIFFKKLWNYRNILNLDLNTCRNCSCYKSNVVYLNTQKSKDELLIEYERIRTNSPSIKECIDTINGLHIPDTYPQPNEWVICINNMICFPLQKIWMPVPSTYQCNARPPKPGTIKIFFTLYDNYEINIIYALH